MLISKCIVFFANTCIGKKTAATQIVCKATVFESVSGDRNYL